MTEGVLSGSAGEIPCPEVQEQKRVRMGLSTVVALIASLSVSLAVGCKTEEEKCLASGGKVLTAAEVKKIYTGNTMSGTIPAFNTKFHVYYHHDGRMIGAAVSGVGKDSDQGTYTIKTNGLLCTRWNKWQGSGCAPIYRHQDEYKIFNPSTGVLFVRQRMRKGNSEKLPLPPSP